MGIGDAGADVVRLQAGVVVQNVLLSNALGQQAQDQFHRYAHIADDGLAAEYVRAGSSWLAGMVLLSLR